MLHCFILSRKKYKLIINNKERKNYERYDFSSIQKKKIYKNISIFQFYFTLYCKINIIVGRIIFKNNLKIMKIIIEIYKNYIIFCYQIKYEI